MKILSLFDGIACAREALKRAGIPVEKYYASEIEMEGMVVAQNNYPDVVQVGDITTLKDFEMLGPIDLLIGGSPCQDLSIAQKNRKGLKGKRSGLFYEYVRILRKLKPKWFILENVASMPAADRAEITRMLGVKPIEINAALVSAQNRRRLFWTNIPNVGQPKDRGILLKDIIHEARGEKFDVEKYIIKGNHLKWITNPELQKKKLAQINGDKAVTMMARQYANWNGQYLSVRVGKIGNGGQGERIYSTKGKSVALSANGGGRGAKTGLYLITRARGKNTGGVNGKKSPTLTSSSWQDNNYLVTGEYVRKLTPVECERLQSLPDGYTKGMSDAKRYRALGNAFNVEVVRHIIKHIPK